MTRIQLHQILFLLPCLLAFSLHAQQQQFASLGDLKLTSGETLHDTLIGYRTFGQLNEAKDNAILFPTWASGTTEQLAGAIHPGSLADSSKYYVIAVDALANGVSSSPSNSKVQPRMQFPKITIRDMVNAEHELLVRTLGIRHLKAVMGISMGGMQTFQWMAVYPDFMDYAIPIVGSPRLAPYDLLLWQLKIDEITNDPAWNGGNYQGKPAQKDLEIISDLFVTTPWAFNSKNTREAVIPNLDEQVRKATFDANDHIRQAQAMMSLDISENYDHSLEKTAAAIKAKVFVIVARYDHVVTPQPALDFAALLHAPTLVLESECGHTANGCEVDKITKAVSDFLSQQ